MTYHANLIARAQIEYCTIILELYNFKDNEHHIWAIGQKFKAIFCLKSIVSLVVIRSWNKLCFKTNTNIFITVTTFIATCASDRTNTIMLAIFAVAIVAAIDWLVIVF